MTEAERLERLEKRASHHEKSMTELTIAVNQIKDTFVRMEKTQNEISGVLKEISASVIETKYLRKEFDELKHDLKHKDEHGSVIEKGLDKRVKDVEDVVKYANLKIIGAVITALLALIIK